MNKVIVFLYALGVVGLLGIGIYLSLDTPVGYADRQTGVCIAVWDNNNVLVPCAGVYDLRYAPKGVKTPEQLSLLLDVPVSKEFRQALAQK